MDRQTEHKSERQYNIVIGQLSGVRQHASPRLEWKHNVKADRKEQIWVRAK